MIPESEKINDCLRDIECGLGSAQALFPYIQPSGEDPSSIPDCMSNVDTGYAAYLTLQKIMDGKEFSAQSKGMKWVKASERLPEGEVYARCNGKTGILKVNLTHCQFSHPLGFTHYEFSSPKLYEIEWLDENNTESKEVEAIEEGLHDIDFDLAGMEDYLHGEDGKKITAIRAKIQQLIKTTQP